MKVVTQHQAEAPWPGRHSPARAQQAAGDPAKRHTGARVPRQPREGARGSQLQGLDSVLQVTGDPPFTYSV